jgi:CRP-like cAMP-binding protein
MPPRSAFDVAAELRLVPGLGAVGAETIEQLAAIATHRTVHANVALVEQGAVATTVVFLVRGAAKAVRKPSIDGADDVVLDVMRAPHVVGDVSTLDGRPSTASVVTLRSSVIVVMERAAVAEIVSHSPLLAQFFLRRAADELRAHVRRIDELVSGSVDERVKHLLEGLARTHGTPLGQGHFIALPLRRKDIANMVNATTETVSRLLAKFERDGLVRSTRDGIWWRTMARAAGAP